MKNRCGTIGLMVVLYLLGVSGAFGLVPSQTAKAQDPAQPATVGRWTARFDTDGFLLRYDGIPVLKGGIVQVFSADGAHGYYGSGGHPPVVTVDALPDGGRAYEATFRYAEGKNSFFATQRIVVRSELDTVTFALHARWQGPEAASLEWNPVRLWAYPLLGASYTAEAGDQNLAQGRIGLRVAGTAYPANRLAPPWQTLRLRGTAVGDLVFAGIPQSDGPVLLDGRADPYLQDDKLFWLGHVGIPMLPGQELVRTITLRLFPKNALPFKPSDTETAQYSATHIHPIPDAQRPEKPSQGSNGDPLIIPQPKQATFSKQAFLLTHDLTVTTQFPHGGAVPALQSALATFLGKLKRDTGVRTMPGATPWNGKGLFVGVAGALPASLPGISLPAVPPHAEGYALRVTPAAIVILGRDPAGAFYGLQTLRQLLRPNPDKTFAFVGVAIQDWPSLRMRGAHLFVGHNALPFHHKLIERIFSRYKLNTLVLECEYTRWKTHPEIHVDYAMRPEDLRADVDDARLHFMEPIPLINSLGHSEWMFQKGQHRDLAEDVRAPHAYDASNPATYRFLFDIYGEAIDIFHPRFFHIGHDEVKILNSDVFGAYPARPENIKKGVTRLFIDDTRHLAEWLHAHGARPMLWGDMLLHSSEGEPTPGVSQLTAANAPSLAEAKQRRTQLPKEAVIADWRYEAGSEQRNGLTVLQKAGFDTLGASWYQPENIRGWAQQAIQHGALGLLQTTWAGYDSNESLLDSEFPQFSAYVLAAEYAWSGTALHPRTASSSTQKTLAYSAGDVFTHAYRNAPLLAAPRAGWALELGEAANVQLTVQDEEGVPWGAYRGNATNDVTSTENLFANTSDIGLRLTGSPPAGIMLRGSLNPTVLPSTSGQSHSMEYPGAAVLPMRASAGTLAFLHATGYGIHTGDPVGRYTLIYTNGKRIDIPLRYGIEIRALDDDGATAYTTTAMPWRAAHVPLTLRLFRWTNPYPDLRIERLEFRTESPEAAPVLFAVTGF